MKTWSAEMPSNIALIKYMGKKDVEKNIPANVSLSWTLPHLTTKVEIQLSDSADQWQPLPSDYPFEMSQKGRDKFLQHLSRVKKRFAVTESFIVKSGNNFPADCGIASSASSFAALTEAACLACSEISGQSIEPHEKALLSARGSGSSCRSFYSGLVQWDEAGVESVPSKLADLLHMVVLVGAGAKEVSSSEAHKRVASSLLYPGRIQRTAVRLEKLMQGIQNNDWSALYQNIWAEFFDMHALFETSDPSFSYFMPGTFSVLQSVRGFWKDNGDGPLVTMDAGPNIHLLWRPDQAGLAQNFYNSNLKANYTCLSNVSEIGFAEV